MKVFSTNKIKTIDDYTIRHEPISSIDLMERASNKLFEEFKRYFSTQKSVKIFVGPGNNGGDALVLARLLHAANYDVSVNLLSSKLSKDAKVNLDRLQILNGIVIKWLKIDKQLPKLSASDVVVDGILGSGISRSVEGFYAQVIQHINKSKCSVFSIDIPSGLFGEDNRQNDPETIIKATFTITFQFPKLSFFFAENAKSVGRWKIVDIGLHLSGIEELSTPYYFIDKANIQNLLRSREDFSHKGNYGHALLLAGSYGKMGASVLAAKAALHSGLGLLTVQVPHCGYSILQTSVPEAMTTIDRAEYLISEYPDLNQFNAVGVGPGVGQKANTKEMLYNLLMEYKKPLVLDADALNILSEEKQWLNLLPENSILTPHPKEFERLTTSTNSSYERHLLQIDFAKKYNAVLVLKGAYTSITNADGICCFNSTGNAGMATAGSGDVLTGIITGLLAQKYEPTEAAILGVWLHGRAGDLYAKCNSVESLTASSIIDFIGKAYYSINNP